MKTSFLLLLTCLLGAATVFAQENSPTETERPTVDGSYVLTPQDGLEIIVFDEPDLSVSQRIDADGRVRMPLIGTIEIAGMTVRVAEDHIETIYREELILREPMVTIRVSEYSPKEINILGAVNRPGKHTFPPEVNRMDIVDVIAMVGGFTPIAKSHEVLIKRTDEEGEEKSFTINVERMISGNSQGRNRFMVQPGDSIWVGEKIW